MFSKEFTIRSDSKSNSSGSSLKSTSNSGSNNYYSSLSKNNSSIESRRFSKTKISKKKK